MFSGRQLPPFFRLLRLRGIMTLTRRTNRPVLSGSGEQILAQPEHQLYVEENLARSTIRNYLSDLRHFVVWREFVWKQEWDVEPSFIPGAMTTPTFTDDRAYFQQKLYLKPNLVNRNLISLKQYFSWLLSTGQIKHNPAKDVKLVGEEAISPRHLSDQEEQALVAAVTEKGDVLDRAIIVFMLDAGLRVRELCTITRGQVRLGKRSGTLTVQGKRNEYRKHPLNVTARVALMAYASSLLKLSHYLTPLFLSEKRYIQLTERGLGYRTSKYADQAHASYVSSHDHCHLFGYRMTQFVPSNPLYRLALLIEHDSFNTTMLYVRGTQRNLQQAVESIAWT